MLKSVAIGLAGAAGALARYWISVGIGVRGFPWATLLINVAGSLALGVLLGATRNPSVLGLAAAVGFLGAFTTFSTFTFEATDLLRDDRATTAVVYVVASVVIGLTVALVGFQVGRSMRS